jgi:rod shape-determining protein MreC
MTSLDRITRRRLVLALLLLVSLGLLTAYFREPAGIGPLHDSQDAVAGAAAPAESLLQRVAQPFRDAWSWSTDLVHAKAERDRLAQQVAVLESQVAALSHGHDDAAVLASELSFVHDPRSERNLAGYRYRGADVTVRAPTLYSSTVQIDAGRSDGVRVGDPVITGHGWLVGQVSRVRGSWAEVMLINDPASAVGAMVLGRAAPGLVRPSSGDPTTLVLEDVEKYRVVEKGDLVATSGWSDRGLDISSKFPPGLLIGVVTDASQSESDLYKQIQVAPKADLGAFSTVLVLEPKARR